jgi:hypothetical protein
LTVTPSRQPPPLTRGRPTPTPSVAPAAVNVTLIVPDAFTVNDRVLCPPGATVLDHVSLIVVEVLLGVVGALLPPHALTARAATTANPEPRIANPGRFMGV